MSSRWTGFFVWALVAASTAFWAMQIFAATRSLPSTAQTPQVSTANGPMERLFGAVVVPTTPVAQAAPESSRFQLVGVIAPPAGATHGGYAIVSIDNQPARTWRVGTTVDGNTALLAVSKRGAEFGPPGGPSSFSLQLPEPAAAETGTLAPATSQPDPAQLQQLQQLQQQQPQTPPVPSMQPAQVDNGQRMAAPVVRGGFARSGATAQPGRGGSPPMAGAPARPGVPPDQQTQNDSGAVQTQ